MSTDSWFGFDHKAVSEKFGGNPMFVGEFDIDGNTWAVYHCAQPDRSKGHKEYVMLASFTTPAGERKLAVSGRSAEAMEKHRYQSGVLCLSCGMILHSRSNHDYRTCHCENETMVDGGRSYLRFGGMDLSLVEVVKIDHLACLALD